jgi:TatD DNase family protein
MIDCHLHLQDLRLGNIPEILVAVRCEQIGCLVVNGTHPDDWEKVAELSVAYPEVIPSFGLHPWRANEVKGDEWRDQLAERLNDFPVAGVGEIGLDRWIKGHNQEHQKRVFRVQLALAAELGRPISVHCLNAWGSLLDCLRKADLSAGCLIHSYGGPVEMIDSFATLGVYFSLSGYFFREEKSEKLRAFEKVPDERLLLETDAPDMLPPRAMRRHTLVSSVGEEINHPANLPAIYEAYAAWRGIRPDDAVDRVKRNFTRWFFSGRREIFLSRFPILNGR